MTGQQEPSPGETHVISQDLLVDSSDPDSSADHVDRHSLTTSLSPSIKEFRHEHGRRYHSFEESQYWLPNDDIEIARLDILHHIWKLCLAGSLQISPIPEDVKDVLDVGTGTGVWAIEFADLHPNSTVLGTDLSPIQPEYMPPNCSFLVDNAEAEWVFDRKFDFIHGRMLLMGIHDWPRFFKQAWDNLNPGGFLEVSNPEFPVCSANQGFDPESPFMKWSSLIREAAGKDGIDTLIVRKHKKMLEDQGFVNVNVQPLKWALGSWPKGGREKTIGEWTLENNRAFTKPSAMALFTKKLGWEKDDVEKFVDEALTDMDNRKKHYYWQM